MTTTLRFNIKHNSSKAQLAYNQLKEAGLNPSFRSGFNDLNGEWLCVDVIKGSEDHKIAKKFQFDGEFNTSKL